MLRRCVSAIRCRSTAQRLSQCTIACRPTPPLLRRTGLIACLGTTVEFKRPGSFPLVEDMVGGGPFNLQPGQWTDDTSMALCLAESLLECDGFDPRDQLRRYVRWYRTGYLSSTGRCFDIGNTVRPALETFERTGEPYAGPVDPDSAGNGSLLRPAPPPMFFSVTPH